MKIGVGRAVILLLVCVKFDKITNKDVIGKTIHCITEHMICSRVPFSVRVPPELGLSSLLLQKIGYKQLLVKHGMPSVCLSRCAVSVVLLATLRIILRY